VSEDCHDCFEPCGGGGDGSGGGRGRGGSGGDGTPRPPRGPNGEELPPWPAWLENPRIIGVDSFNGRPVAVGLFMNDEVYTEDTTPNNAKHLKGRRIPHSNDGLAMAAILTGDNRWVSTHLARTGEIAAYDAIILEELKVEETDMHLMPPYAVSEIPPFPAWLVDGLVVYDAKDDQGRRERLAVGRNEKDGYWWVVRSLDSYEWSSFRYADNGDRLMYDVAFLKTNHIAVEVRENV